MIWQVLKTIIVFLLSLVITIKITNFYEDEFQALLILGMFPIILAGVFLVIFTTIFSILFVL